MKRFETCLDAWAKRDSEPTHLIGLSLFRIVAGLAILSQFLTVYRQRYYLFGNEGLIPYESYRGQMSHFSLYWFTSSDWSFDFLYHLSIAVVATWTLGYRSRLLTPVVFYCWTSFTDRGPPIWDGGDNLMAILLVFATFANVGAYLSVSPRGYGKPSPASGIFHNTAVRAVGLQLCVVYFVAGIMKARGQTWLDGSALYASCADREFGWPGVTDRIADNTLLMSVLGPFTILFQLAFPFLFLLNRRTRSLIVLIAMGFHVSIALSMGLLSFAAFFIAAELAVIGDDEYRAVARRIQSWRAGRTIPPLTDSVVS